MIRFAAALALLLSASPALAAFQDCLNELRADAASKGVSARTIDSATHDLSFDPDLLAFETAQPEFQTKIWDYLAGLVDDERVNDGRAQMHQWAHAFSVAESRYGVDAPVIAAIWGVESNFGQNFGKRPIIQSLATLSCEGRRQAFFRGEFIAALKILDAGDVDPNKFMGSWAGAFGHTQFMPSTFLRIAVDLDGDGRRDLIGSVPDALGSTANYLHKSGWVAGLPWGFEVRLPEHYTGPSGFKNKEPMSVWARRGITRIDGSQLGEGSAGLLMPAGPDGPAFLVTRNFNAIFAYNASESYVLAVSLLSDRLRGLPGVRAAWPTNDPGLSRAQRRELQALLIKRGYDLDGKMDGVIGSKTRAAIIDFQTKAGLPAHGRASESVLAALQGR
jgi:lytic murein transglycosylase